MEFDELLSEQLGELGRFQRLYVLSTLFFVLGIFSPMVELIFQGVIPQYKWVLNLFMDDFLHTKVVYIYSLSVFVNVLPPKAGKLKFPMTVVEFVMFWLNDVKVRITWVRAIYADYPWHLSLYDS